MLLLHGSSHEARQLLDCLKIFGEKQTAEKELPGFLSECFTQIAVPGTKNFLFCPILIVLYEEEGFISLSLITSLELGKAFQVLFCPSPDKRRRKRRDERRQEKVRERKTNEGKKEGKKLNQEGKRRQSQKAQRMREIEKKYSVSCKSGLKKSKKPTRRSLREKTDISGKEETERGPRKKARCGGSKKGDAKRSEHESAVWEWMKKFLTFRWFWKIHAFFAKNLGLAKTCFVFK